MRESIKNRIDAVRRGEVPEGYRTERAMLFPNEWGDPVPLNTVLTENKDRNEDLHFGKEDVLSVSGEQGIINQIDLLGRSYAGESVAAYHMPRPTILMQTGAQCAAPRLIGGKHMARKEHHIVPNSNGGWDVKRENAKRSSGHYETKKEAMEAGRRMSINQGTELIPHRKDGTIQNPNSHGNDPCPPRDKK